MTSTAPRRPAYYHWSRSDGLGTTRTLDARVAGRSLIQDNVDLALENSQRLTQLSVGVVEEASRTVTAEALKADRPNRAADPATKSLAAGALPIGLAHNVRPKRSVAKDTVVSFHVELDRDLDVVELRREMERSGAPAIVNAG